MNCTTTMYFDADTFLKMKEVAKANGTSVSKMLQKLFLEYLEKEVEDK